jgi:glycosyltransferase involved in cell wall biosynthesis
LPGTLIIHNFYSKVSPSGENHVVNYEKNNFDHQFFAFSDVATKRKNKILSIITFFKYRKKIRNRLDRVLQKHSFDEIVIHNTFPIIGTSFIKRIPLGTKVKLRLHNYRYQVTCATFSDKKGKYCDLCLRKNIRLSLLPIFWRCYNGSFKKSAMVQLSLIKIYFLNPFRRLDEIEFFSNYQKLLFQKVLTTDVSWKRRLNQVKTQLILTPWKNRGKKNHYIFIGRLYAEKGLKILLKTWDKWETEIRLDVYGSGPLEKEVKAASLHSNVKYMGYLEDGHKDAVMSNGALLLVPSQCVEGHPLIIEESKLRNMPGLISDIGPLEEFAKDTSLRIVDFTQINLRETLTNYHRELQK